MESALRILLNGSEHRLDQVRFSTAMFDLKAVTSSIINRQADRGLMVCSTGVRTSIAANRIEGIRAAVCHDVHSAHRSVERVRKLA